MASNPITASQIDGEKLETVTDFIILSFKITAEVTAATKLTDSCSLKWKLWQPLQCIKKQRHHFANKGPYSQRYIFYISHVWMWELDHKHGWVPKNWCFQIVVLEKPLESPWTARRSNQSILKESNPEYSLEGLMLNLKRQSFSHLMWRANSLEKILIWERLKATGEGDVRG